MLLSGHELLATDGVHQQRALRLSPWEQRNNPLLGGGKNPFSCTEKRLGFMTCVVFHPPFGSFITDTSFTPQILQLYLMCEANPMEESLIVAYLIKKFPVFYGDQSFIIIFT
jgi:hypothetical protein